MHTRFYFFFFQAEDGIRDKLVTGVQTCALPISFAAALSTAAQWHDIGKAHDEFQKMLRNGDAARERQLWAKSADKDGKCDRRGFRHELGSALAWLLKGPADAAERALVGYLIAAHHGKV